MRAGIRVRITAIAAGAVAAVLIAASLGLLAAQRHTLTSNLDESLESHSATIEAALAAGDIAEPLPAQGDDDAFAQVVRDGRVIAATANVAGLEPLPAPRSSSATRTLELNLDEDEFRVLSRVAGDTVIHVGSPTDDIDESVEALRTGLLVAVPAAVLLIAAVVWLLVGRTLRPVESIRAQVAAISGERLDRRVPEPHTDDEIARLARTMNEMLQRIEEASNRQQRFIADASHELRSPLTRIRTELEVDLTHPDTADLAGTHHSVLEELDHLQRLVEDLLELARADAGAGPRVELPVDLDDVVLAEADRAREAIASGRPAIDTSRVSAAQTRGDASALARAVRNVLDNAARHAVGLISLAVREDDGAALITVSDDGPGIPAAERARVFERFARLDESRHASTGGTGLGLAIALAIVRQHGGSITIEEPDGRGTRFVFRLPANGTPPP